MKKKGPTSKFVWHSLINLKQGNISGTRYGSWDTEWETEFFAILGNFLSFYPPNNLKNQNFEKIKKAAGDVTILHMSVKNHNHMMFTSWDMETDRHNFLSFWTIFALLPHYWLWKLKFGNVKKPGYVILLQMCTTNEDHMM